MQSYHSTPVKITKSPDPLSDLKVLAALLVPQIEGYLASNPSTRLLVLHYPASHLSTVVALRDLLGLEIIKIAGILDSLASDPPSMSRPRTPIAYLSNENASIHNAIHHNSVGLARVKSILKNEYLLDNLMLQRSAAAGAIPSSPKNTKSTSTSFAKADYLLPSTATDSEITIFLSNVWKILMSISAFYCPEPELELKPVVVDLGPLPPTPPYVSRNRDRDSGYPFMASNRGTASKISRLTGNSDSSVGRPQTPTSTITTTNHATASNGGISHSKASPSIPSKRGYATSIASTKTRRSERDRIGWENFYIGEEDSEDDEFDRMILGRGLARIVPEVRNGGVLLQKDKKKALKWLGLA